MHWLSVYHEPLDAAARDRLTSKLRRMLAAQGDVAAAYLHGSFGQGDMPFRDLDVAILFVGEPDPGATWRREGEIGAMLTEELSYPVDAKALNHAPLRFRGRVLASGELLVSPDERARIQFVERTLALYPEYRRYEEAYRREALGLGA